LRSTLIIALLLLFSFSQAQDKKIMIWGFVEEDGKPLLGAKVYVYADDTQIRSVYSDEKGRFEVDLNYDAYYRFEFYKRNYVKKKIEIDATEVPEDDKRFGHEWGGWQVELLRKVPGLDTSIYEFPVAKAVYEEDEANFGFDYSYMHQKEEEFKEAEKEQKRLIKEYEKQLKEEEAKYAELMANANKAFENDEKEEALKAYNAVLEFRSNDQLAIERSELLTALLNREEMYAKYKGQSKASEAGNELSAAVEFWRKAKPLNPESDEAQKEIERITALIQAKEAELLAEQRAAEAATIAEEEAQRMAAQKEKERQLEEERKQKEAEAEAQRLAEEERLKKEKEEADRLLAERQAEEMAAAESSSGEKKNLESLKDMDMHSEAFVMELAKIYPDGVTEEVEKFKNRTVYKRIVVKGNRGHLYEKVVYNYGGKFYFKDGDSVGQFIWDKETVLD